MKVIFLAYRDWALRVYPSVQKHPKVEEAVLCQTQDELTRLELEKYDLLITCGWSSELGPDVLSKIQAIGVHCAELDRYSYGTPIQNQILDGVKYTKHRVFPFKWDPNSERAHTHTREYSHEVLLDLSGNMEDIFLQLTATAIVLFNMFLDDYPNIVWKKWEAEEIVRSRRTPDDSRLTKEDLINMNTEQLYDFFRCLESPYPNGYIEDEIGRLYIQRVAFKRKELR